MREIKFKFWDTTLKEFTRYYEASPNDIFEFNQGRYIALQYTGLGDSEAKEEYFGYIIEEDDGTKRVIEDGASVVLFKAIVGKDIKYFWELLPHKVIGNIWQNEELLGVKV